MCRLPFSDLRAAKSSPSKDEADADNELLIEPAVAVDMGILATVDPEVVEPAVVEAPDDANAGFGNFRLLRGNGLGLIRAPAAESSLPSEPDGGDTVLCCDTFAEAAAGKCFPSRSIWLIWPLRLLYASYKCRMGSFSALTGMRPCLRAKFMSYCFSCCFKSRLRARRSAIDMVGSNCVGEDVEYGVGEPGGEPPRALAH